MGDGMADWLAYGLEDAFADAPEIAILRKNKAYSGLLRYESKSDLDWWHVARDILAQEKPNYVVMMLGVTDRQNIREQDLAKEAEKKPRKTRTRRTRRKAGRTRRRKTADQPPRPPTPNADERRSRGNEAALNGIIEFRSDQWAEVYIQRIDETIAALKSKGVPVFWVGLPPIRGTKSTADASYLNDLYRARAERAGIIYIDVWDGFVDEDGKFTTLRARTTKARCAACARGDGVYFTKSGARKLAHYVEREIRRYMSNRVRSRCRRGADGPTPAGQADRAAACRSGLPLTVTPSKPTNCWRRGARACMATRSHAGAGEGRALAAPRTRRRFRLAARQRAQGRAGHGAGRCAGEEVRDARPRRPRPRSPPSRLRPSRRP